MCCCHPACAVTCSVPWPAPARDAASTTTQPVATASCKPHLLLRWHRSPLLATAAGSSPCDQPQPIISGLRQTGKVINWQASTLVAGCSTVAVAWLGLAWPGCCTLAVEGERESLLDGWPACLPACVFCCIVLLWWRQHTMLYQYNYTTPRLPGTNYFPLDIYYCTTHSQLLVTLPVLY